jgi:hypothetical protein
MGGTEFISLHLLRALQARGHEVTVFIRDRRGSGFWGGQRPTLGGYVTGMGASRGLALPEVVLLRPRRRASCYRVSTGELPPTSYSGRQGRWRQPRVFSAPHCSALKGVQAGYRLITQRSLVQIGRLI